MSKFVQIIEFRATPEKFAEMLEYQESWGETRGADENSPESVVVTKDRDRDDWYLSIVTFPSREAAEANNDNPVTQEFSAKMATFVSEPPKFHNLDVQFEADL